MFYGVMFVWDGKTHPDKGDYNQHPEDINNNHFYSSPSSRESPQIEKITVAIVPSKNDITFIPIFSLDAKGFNTAITTINFETSKSVLDSSLR